MKFDQIIERDHVTSTEYYILIVVFLFGGTVKGALGIGLPTLLIGFLTLFYEPRMAVAMILFSIMAANMRQAFVGGDMWQIVKRYKYFCIFASVGIFVVALMGSKVPLPILQISVGISMSIFALNGLFVNSPQLPQKYDTPAQIVGGIGSGILGGLTAIWGPPLAIYLMSLKLQRDQFIQALGVMFSIQSLFLTAGFIVSGELTMHIARIGAALLIPTFIGMYIGEKIRRRMNIEQFTRAFLCLFLILGLNLIRRGIMDA
jgi:uncharacterized membrane protein YfcA